MVTFSWISSGVILAPSPEQKVFQTEEKFQNPEQIQPRTVIIANSNDWNSKFAYDLDPGIEF